MKPVAQQLFEWWQAPDADPGLLFSSEMDFRGVSRAMKGEDWLFLVRQKLPWTDLEVLQIDGNEDRGALVFEGVDPVTALKHRIAWFVEARNGLIHRLIEVGEHVE